MSIKIAIPDNRIFKELFFNIEEVCNERGIGLIKDSEQTIEKLFATNKVDAAFLNPISYARGVSISDYRIIPNNIMVAKSYTRLASTFFKSNLTTIKTCGSPSPDDFLMKIGKLMLLERYGMDIELKKTESGKVDEILENFDSAMVWKKSFKDDRALDITEDWFDSFQIPLVLGTWVVRNEEEPENIEKLINSFPADSVQNVKEIKDKFDTDIERQGGLIYEWSEEIEKAYDATLELLFYHGYVDKMAAVKLIWQKLEDVSEDIPMLRQEQKEDGHQ